MKVLVLRFKKTPYMFGIQLSVYKRRNKVYHFSGYSVVSAGAKDNLV